MWLYLKSHEQSFSSANKSLLDRSDSRSSEENVATQLTDKISIEARSAGLDPRIYASTVLTGNNNTFIIKVKPRFRMLSFLWRMLSVGNSGRGRCLGRGLGRYVFLVEHELVWIQVHIRRVYESSQPMPIMITYWTPFEEKRLREQLQEYLLSH